MSGEAVSGREVAKVDEVLCHALDAGRRYPVIWAAAFLGGTMYLSDCDLKCSGWLAPMATDPRLHLKS